MNSRNLILGLSAAALFIYIVDGGATTDEKQRIESQKLGNPSTVIVDTSKAPKNVDEAFEDELMKQYLEVSKNTNKTKDAEIINLYHGLYIRDWGLRRDIKEGDVKTIQSRAVDYIDWMVTDMNALEDLIESINYTTDQVNSAIASGYDDGNIQTLRQNIKEDIIFLTKIVKQ